MAPPQMIHRGMLYIFWNPRKFCVALTAVYAGNRKAGRFGGACWSLSATIDSSLDSLKRIPFSSALIAELAELKSGAWKTSGRSRRLWRQDTLAAGTATNGSMLRTYPEKLRGEYYRPSQRRFREYEKDARRGDWQNERKRVYLCTQPSGLTQQPTPSSRPMGRKFSSL